jgi:hypothetical protein
MSNTISLAVWDVPMPVVAGERFAIKVGATAAAGTNIDVIDPAGKVVASGPLGNEPFSGTQALRWTSLDVPAPAMQGVVEHTVRAGAASSRFSVAVAAKPEHTLTVTVTEKDSKEALGGVEIRLGPFRARTGKDGRAEVRICKGDYQVQLWRTAHIAQPQAVTIDGDTSIALTMTHVPEEHPDARWVR